MIAVGSTLLFVPATTTVPVIASGNASVPMIDNGLTGHEGELVVLESAVKLCWHFSSFRWKTGREGIGQSMSRPAILKLD